MSTVMQSPFQLPYDMHRIPCAWCAALTWRSGGSFHLLVREGYIHHRTMKKHIPGCPVEQMPELDHYDRIRRRREMTLAGIAFTAILVATFFAGYSVYQRTIVSKFARFDTWVREITTANAVNMSAFTSEILRVRHKEDDLERSVQLAVEYVEGYKELALAEIRSSGSADPAIQAEARERAKSDLSSRSVPIKTR